MTKPKSTGGCGTFFILAILFAIAQLVEENRKTICIILIVILLIILLCIIFKHKGKHKASFSPITKQPIDLHEEHSTNSQLNYANSLLKRAYHLADILNTTLDREEFFISFDELSSVLKSLSELEGDVNFSGALPSDELKKINAEKQASIDFLERRIKESQAPGNSYISSEPIHEYSAKENEDVEIQSQNDFGIESAPKLQTKLEVDFYFVDAGKFIIEKEKASVGMLQRMFKIGFNRATKIMDQLCDAGVVGPEEGSKPRKVLMSMSQFEKFLDTVELTTLLSEPDTVSDSNSSFCTLSNPTDDRIQMYNGKYDYMEGHDFERFCAQLLEANGFYNVNVTPGSNDQGIDILAEKQSVKYAIQCKRYSSDVGNKAVQEVFAGKSYYNCHVGVVLTNRYFTQSAKELAEKTQIFLWNRDVLNALCENYYKKEYIDDN